MIRHAPTAEIECPALEDRDVRVRAMRGHERISSPFEFDVDLVVLDDDELDPAELVNGPASLVVEAPGRPRRTIHGVVESVRECFEVEDGRRGLTLRLVPRLWRLSLHRRQDVFVDLTVPRILQRVLESHGLREKRDFELRMLGRYPVRDFVVQYKESDLAFVSRLAEHVGISFFFEHEEDRDVVVFSDHNCAFRELAEGDATLGYDSRAPETGVFRFGTETRAVPSRVVVQDYNYRTPRVDLEASAGLDGGSDGEWVEYGDHFKTGEEGSDLARIRAEELLCQRRAFQGESDVHSLRSGARFHLDGLPRRESLELVAVEVEHELVQPLLDDPGDHNHRYRNRFRCTPYPHAFRPARRTPRPRVNGVITGVVEPAEDSRYARVDDEGRYQVKFLFDGRRPGEGRASKPVRMAQSHSGDGYGMHFPLRPGVEVMLTCVDGDPDRPIVAGTVPNPSTPSPVGEANHRRNVIRTGAGNEVNISDDEGEERIKLTTPHANTTFQLGAPNAPESGSILTTLGASSSVAAAGNGVFTSLQVALSVFHNLRAASHIIDIARKPSRAEKGIMAAGFASALGGVLSRTLTTVKASVDAVQQVEGQDLVQSETAVAEQQEHSAAADNAAADRRDELAAAIDASSDSSPEQRASWRSALDERAEAHEAVRAELESKRAAREAEQLQLYEALRQERVASAELHERNVAALDLEIRELEQGLDGVEPPAGDRRAALDDLLEQMASEDPSLEGPAARYGSSLGEQAGASTARQAAREAWLAAQRQHDDSQHEFSEGETGEALRNAEVIVAAGSGATALLSAIYTLYTILKKTQLDLGQDTQWANARDCYRAVETEEPKVAPLLFGAGPRAVTGVGPEKKSVNCQGSDGSAVVFGEERAFVWGETALLLGRSKPADPSAVGPPEEPSGQAVVMGENLAAVMSAGHVRVEARKSSVVSAGQGLTLKVGKTRIEIDADGNVAIEAAGKDISFRGQNIRLEADAQIQLAAANVDIQ